MLRSTRTLSYFAVAMLLLGRTAAAEEVRQVEGPRVELSELLPGAPAGVGEVDICKSPRPGSSVLLTRQDIKSKITAAGYDASNLNLPAVLRVQSPGSSYSPAQLSALVQPKVAAALPPGVNLQSVSVVNTLTLPNNVEVSVVEVGEIPKRLGSQRIGLSVELSAHGEPLMRLPLTVQVSRSQASLKAAVTRGKTVRLVWQRNSARIEVDATALSDADVGQVVNFRVQVSNKMLKGRVLSEGVAVVSEGG